MKRFYLLTLLAFIWVSVQAQDLPVPPPPPSLEYGTIIVSGYYGFNPWFEMGMKSFVRNLDSINASFKESEGDAFALGFSVEYMFNERWSLGGIAWGGRRALTWESTSPSGLLETTWFLAKVRIMGKLSYHYNIGEIGDFYVAGAAGFKYADSGVVTEAPSGPKELVNYKAFPLDARISVGMRLFFINNKLGVATDLGAGGPVWNIGGAYVNKPKR